MAKNKTANSFFEDAELDEELLDEVDQYQADAEEEVPEDEYVSLAPTPKPLLKQGRPMIVTEKKTDAQTIVRKRVPLTKSMCRKPKCSYDAAREMRYPSYKNVPPARRQECVDLLKQHVAMAHSFNDSHIIFESDLATEFFGVE